VSNRMRYVGSDASYLADPGLTAAVNQGPVLRRGRAVGASSRFRARMLPRGWVRRFSPAQGKPAPSAVMDTDGKLWFGTFWIHSTQIDHKTAPPEFDVAPLDYH
jgi:hypothetical protein